MPSSRSSLGLLVLGGLALGATSLEGLPEFFLEGLFVALEPVLLPGVVEYFTVEAVLLHARLEEPDQMFVVGRLRELQLLTVLHVVLEARREAAAQLSERGLDLLFLDVVVLLVFGSSGESLPWELSEHEVQKNVTDGLEIVSS